MDRGGPSWCTHDFRAGLGIESKAVTLSIVLPLLLTYVWISGFAGVLVTDFIQTMVILAANIMLVIMVLIHFGGPDGLVSAITSAYSAAESGSILSAFPVPGHKVFGPLVVFAWFIVCTTGYGGGSIGCDGQRTFSCKNSREAAKAWVWSEISLFAMLLLLTLPVLGAVANHPDLYHAVPKDREQCYGDFTQRFSSSWIFGRCPGGITLFSYVHN